MADRVIETTEYELLYGQIGYISAIQYVQSFIDNPCYKIPDTNDNYIDLLSHPKVIK